MSPGRYQLLFFAFFLASCGGPREEEETTTVPPSSEELSEQMAEADQIIQRELDRQKTESAASFPCSLFEQRELETLLGNPVDSGDHTFEHRSENDRSWRSEACSWSSTEEGGAEMSLWVSRPEHFDSGRVECYSPLDRAAGELSGMGDSAWWTFDKYWGIGTLRACSEKALVEVKITRRGGDEESLESIARTIAERLLSAS